MRPARNSAVRSATSWAPGTCAWSIASVATPPSRVTVSAQPARRGTPVNRASSERKAVSSRSGLRPASTRRYVLSSTRSPIAVIVSASSRPSGVSAADPTSSAADPTSSAASCQTSANPGDGRQTSAASTCPLLVPGAVDVPSRVIAGIVRPLAIAAASARQAPSPSAASRTTPSRSTKGIAYRSIRSPGRPVSTSTRASATSGARAKAWARRADAGAPAPGAYHRRVPRSARSRSRTAPKTAAASSGPGWGLTGSITGAPCARAMGWCR